MKTGRIKTSSAQDKPKNLKNWLTGNAKVFIITMFIFWIPALICQASSSLGREEPLPLGLASLGFIIFGFGLVDESRKRLRGKGTISDDVLAIFAGMFFASVLILTPSVIDMVKDFQEIEKYDYSSEVKHTPLTRDVYRISVYRSNNNSNEFLLHLDRSGMPDLIALGFNTVTMSSDSFPTVRCEGKGNTWGSNIVLNPESGSVQETGQPMKCPFTLTEEMKSQVSIDVTVNFVYAIGIPPAPEKIKTGFVTEAATETFNLVLHP